MSMKHGANRYKQTAVLTASKPQVLIMLYEAAIRHLRHASLAIDEGNIPQKGTSIGKAHDIINELMNSLNFDVGGTIAQDLERLYNFMTEMLVKANLENSKEDLQSVVKILENLLEGWRGAIQQLQGTGQVQK
jgi:flagellar secretion chaperone FliS